MASIQFRGVSNVVAGFADMNCDYWAIFEGRYLRFKGEGEASLKKTLNTLKSSYSEATYTVVGYMEMEKKTKLSLSTPCDGSFNFKLYSDDEDEDRNPRRMEFEGRRTTMIDRIAGIEQRLDLMLQEREEDEEPEPEPKNKLGIIGELMESPLGPVINKVLLQWFAPGTAPAAVAAAIGNIPATKTVASPGSTAINDDTAGVVARLIAHDPKMPERLKMLLELADTDKPMFDMVMAQFDKLK